MRVWVGEGRKLEKSESGKGVLGGVRGTVGSSAVGAVMMEGGSTGISTVLALGEMVAEE